MSHPGAILALALVLATTTPDPSRQVRPARDLGGLEASSAALILSGQEGGELPVEMLALPLPATEGRSRVVLVMDIRPPAESEPSRLEIYAYALQGDHLIADFLTQAIDLPPTGAPSSVKLVAELELEGGEYLLQLLVRHQPSGIYGLRRSPLSVLTAGFSPWPPLFEDRSHDAVYRGAGSSPRLPFLPSARPSFVPGQKLDFYLVGEGLPERTTIRLLDQQRRELLEQVEVELGPAQRELGLEWSRVEIGSLELRGGDYLLESDLEGARSASFSVGSEGLRPSGSSSDPTRPEAARTSSSELRLGYLRAIRLLAESRTEAAMAAMAQLEESVLLQADSRQLESILELLLGLGERLAYDSPENLLPLLALHEQLYRQYHPASRYQLATHARKMIEGLSQIQGSDGRALVSIAGYLQELGATSSARSQYERALQLDPGQTGALLGLATLHEAYGEYETAVSYLDRALKESPDSDEVQLRLAVNLARLERSRRAERFFRAALPSETEWIRVVALQELAALFVADRRTGEAIALLQSAIEGNESHPRLHIQLASILDRRGRPQRARAVLSGLDLRRGSESDSPRFRYSRWPTWAFEEARAGLQAEASLHLDDLARALDVVTTEEPD